MLARLGRLGIMVTEREKVPPFSDSSFYRRLILLGANKGLIVYVFSPQRMNWSNRQVEGYGLNKETKRWEKRIYPFPDLIYDRCFFHQRKSYLIYRNQMRLLQKDNKVRFIGHGLKGKWQVQELLSEDSKISDHLPKTVKVAGERTVRSWLEQEGEIILKPQGGSQGRGVMHICMVEDPKYRFRVKGRDPSNRLFHYGFCDRQALSAWLRKRIEKRNYVAQSYLTLTTENDEPFDIRSFIQKNGKGRWQLVGMALRKGKPGSLTSNLHGGGVAEEVEPFLRARYEESADEILDNIRKLSQRIARTLERSHGRLLELGIDFGIDRSGKLWVLEVNSKPGRSIFTQIDNLPARRTAVSNPILYARYLWDRQLGG